MNGRNIAICIQEGFALIELMIVTAIVGILLAFTLYIDYVGRSQVAVALAEITPAKINIEAMITTEIDAADAIALTGDTNANARIAGLVGSTTSRCVGIAFAVESTGAASITCTLKGRAQIHGLKIRLSRVPNATPTATSSWICDTSVATKFVPKTCNFNAALV